MEQKYRRLQKTVKEFYKSYGRHDLPWRQLAHDRRQRFYEVWVSEIMLQQTSVPRVLPKFHEWIESFPTIESVAAAPLGEVLKRWQGLGYNRRAKYLWDGAKLLAGKKLPGDLMKLEKIPGIGSNTKGAIIAYVDNKPAVFVETNIRTVFLHDVEDQSSMVADVVIYSHVKQSLPKENVREWYWALMDYGAHLKKRDNHLSRARAYKKQSSFQGSRRQLRGEIIRQLTVSSVSRATLKNKVKDDRFEEVIKELAKENLVIDDGKIITLP